MKKCVCLLDRERSYTYSDSTMRWRRPLQSLLLFKSHEINDRSYITWPWPSLRHSNSALSALLDMNGEQSSEPDPRVDWDSRYRTGWVYGKAPNDFLVEAIDRFITAVKIHEPRTVLSIGEGQGRNVVYLASRGFLCTAVDGSAGATESTLRLAEQRGVLHMVRAITANAFDFDYEESSYDIILSIFCMFPADQRARLHQRYTSALKPGGLIIVECFSPGQIEVNAIRAQVPGNGRSWGMGPPPSCLVSAEELCLDFDCLSVLLAREVRRVLREGKFHRGPAACTQYVATKPVLAAYRTAVDVVFAEAARRPEGGLALAHTAPGADALLANAAGLLREACAHAEQSRWCRYCWCPCDGCLCEWSLARPAEGGHGGNGAALHWVFVVHPNEFLRSTSSAKFAAQYLSTSPGSAELLVYGCEAHGTRLRAIIDSSSRATTPAMCVLFPTGEGGAGGGPPVQSVLDFLGGSDSSAPPTVRPGRRTIIVPDGSWANAAQLVKWMEARGPSLPRVALDDDAVKKHHSPLIEALKAGQGLGRISTLEACALFLRAGGEEERCRGLLRCLQPIVEYVKISLNGQGPPPGDCPASLSTESLVATLRCVAATEGLRGLPAGLRRCVLCGENLATPTRMEQHLKGAKHCTAVARRYMATVHDISAPASPLAIWKECSINVLCSFTAEPPDVALHSLKAALALQKGSARPSDPEPAPPRAPVVRRSKGERALEAATKPRVSSPLPQQLRGMTRLSFDPDGYPLYAVVAQLLCRTTAVGRYPQSDNIVLEAFEPRADIFRVFKERQVLYNAVSADTVFLDVYERLIKNVICPFIKKELQSVHDIEADSEYPRVSFHYQYPPSLRIQAGRSNVFGRVHRDLEYGHQEGEINFWMPLTDVRQTSTTLWAESAPDLGDFSPLDVNYSEIASFHGSLCHHYVPPNRSPHTRVSMDFRVGVGEHFDPKWELPGTMRTHGRRVVYL